MAISKSTRTFALRERWLDSSGREHAVIVKKGTIAAINKWAKSKGLRFRRDRSLFGGSYFGPGGEWYDADVYVARKSVKKATRRK